MKKNILRLIKKITRCCWLLVIMASIITSTTVSAQENVTIPTYHWSYDYLKELSLRYSDQWYPFNRLPYSQKHINDLIDNLQNRSLSQSETFLLNRLREFRNPVLTEHPKLQLGSRVIEKTGDFGEDLLSRLNFRTQIGIFPDKHFSIINVIRLDEELDDDPTYIGKSWRGFTGYTEQAYGLLKFGKYTAKFGRDFIQWGRGFDATLLISDFSRPLDHLNAGFNLKRIQFNYIIAKLNSVFVSDSIRQVYGANNANRYLTAVRADFVLKPNVFTMAVTQMVLYGGPGRNFELNYLNPFLIFHGEQVNDQFKGNTFGAIDFVFRPQRKMELYGQLMIDDIQVEKTKAGDLEPNEIGYIIGGEIADPLGLSGSTLGIEYTRVANRTYNTISEWEKFVHRNQPIAHFLGNDFDRWLFHGRKYLGKNLRLKGIVDIRRHGEGQVNGIFTTPWQNLTLEQGYNEKFPFGIVEHNTNFELQTRWHPSTDFFVELSAKHSRYRNFKNQQNVDKDETSFIIKLWWEKLWLLGLD